MNGLMNYIDWRKDLSFSRDPFNEVDNVIFSELSYLPVDNIVSPMESNKLISIPKLAEKLFKDKEPKDISVGIFIGNDQALLLDKIKNTTRFKGVKVGHLTNVINFEMQFSATTYILNNKLIYIAFKGTDDTLRGWEEDFMMTYRYPVPAQKSGLEYTIEIMNRYPHHRFIIGGHSKGGNIATYVIANLKEEYQDRVVHVYNNDGPGFIDKTIDPKLFDRIQDKMTLLIPQESVVGQLFNNYIKDVRVATSTNRGILQHDMFSWGVLGNKFVNPINISDKSINAKEDIDELLNNLSMEQRRALGRDIANYIKEVKVGTLTELTRDPLRSIAPIRDIKKDNRKVMNNFIGICLKNRLF